MKLYLSNNMLGLDRSFSYLVSKYLGVPMTSNLILEEDKIFYQESLNAQTDIGFGIIIVITRKAISWI